MVRVPRPYDQPDPTLQPARSVAQIDERVAQRIGSSGHQLGNAIEAIGNAFAAVGERTAAVQDATNSARAKLDWMKFDNEAWHGLSNSVGEDGTGWENQPSIYDKGRQDILAKYPISNPQRRAELEMYLERQIAERGFSAARLQQSQRGAHFKRIEDQELASAVARIEANPSQETVDAMRGPLTDLVESGRGNYHSAATIERRKREIEGALMMGQYRGLLKTDPDAAAELIGKIRAGKYEIDQGYSGIRGQVDRTGEGLKTLGGNIRPQGIVFHHTSGTTADGAIATLKQRGLSYNFLIERDGTIITLVPPERGALHMRPSDKGLSNQNAIGISFVGRNDDDVTPEQRSAGRALAAELGRRFQISPQNVFGHGEVNAHKEKGEGATDAQYIRANGFGVTEAGGQRSTGSNVIPLAQRGLVQVAGLKPPTSDAGEGGEAPSELNQTLDKVRAVANDQPDTPLVNVIDRDTLIAMADQYPEIASIPDFDEITVAEALKAVEASGLAGTRQRQLPTSDELAFPMGRLVGGQVFTVKSKHGEIRIPAESVNALDKSTLRRFAAEAKEMQRIRQREGEAIADDMIKKQLLTIETTGKDHSEFDPKMLADVYRKQPKKIQDFERKAKAAREVYETLADAVNLPNDVLEERIDTLRERMTDAYGDSDPAVKAALDRAERKVKQITTLRDRDPARSVRDTREVLAVRGEIPGGEPKNKAHLYQLADATLKAQTRLGLPQVPITRAEARTIMADITYAPEPEKRKVAIATAEKVAETYGNLAPQVMAAAIKLATGDTRDDDDALNAAMRRVGRGAATVKDVDRAVSGATKKGDKLPTKPNFFDRYE